MSSFHKQRVDDVQAASADLDAAAKANMPTHLTAVPGKTVWKFIGVNFTHIRRSRLH